MIEEPQNPYVRLQRMGVRGVSPIDLAAVGFSRRLEDVAENEVAAQQLMKKCGKALGIDDIAGKDLKDLFGLEGFENHRALALIELGVRGARAKRGDIRHIERPEDAYVLVSDYCRQHKEYFVAILLDAKNAVMRIAEIHVGTLTASLVGPREVFREAIRDGASSIIVAHNHPSGDPTPSAEDHQVTKRLVEVGELLDIRVHDHLIIGSQWGISVMSGKKIGR